MTTTTPQAPDVVSYASNLPEAIRPRPAMVWICGQPINPCMQHVVYSIMLR